MKTITAEQAKASFDESLEAAKDEPIIVTDEGHALGVFFSVETLKQSAWGQNILRECEESCLTQDELKTLRSNRFRTVMEAIDNIEPVKPKPGSPTSVEIVRKLRGTD